MHNSACGTYGEKEKQSKYLGNTMIEPHALDAVGAQNSGVFGL